MQPFIAEKREQIAEVCRRYKVRRLTVFGSAVREDFDPARSDVDLVVEFEPVSAEHYFDNKSALRRALSAILGREVDLLTLKSIRNSYLLREVQAAEALLYAA